MTQLPLGFDGESLEHEPSDFLKSDFETAAGMCGPPYLSPSSISSLLTCPERFRHEYVLRKPRPPGAWAISGSAFHGARHYILEAKQKGYEPSEDDVRKAWQKAFDASAAQARNGTTPADLEGMKAASWSMLKVYEEKIAPLIQGVVAVEDRGRLYVPGVPMVVIGRLDLELEDEIVDTKTGTQSKKAPEPTWMVQGVIYSAMREKAMTWHTIGYTQSGNVTFQTPATAPQLRRAWRPRITELAHLYVREAYEALLLYSTERGPDRPWPGTGIASGACRYCDHKGSCPFYL